MNRLHSDGFNVLQQLLFSDIVEDIRVNEIKKHFFRDELYADLSLFRISIGLVSEVICLWQHHASRKIIHILSVETASITGRSGFMYWGRNWVVVCRSVVQ